MYDIFTNSSENGWTEVVYPIAHVPSASADELDYTLMNSKTYYQISFIRNQDDTNYHHLKQCTEFVMAKK